MKDVAEAYKVLGLTSSSSIEIIKDRYHSLVKEYHPDVNSENTDANSKILGEITAAYNLIINYIDAGRKTNFKPVEKDPKQAKAAENAFRRGRMYLEKGDINSALDTFATIYRQFPENTKYLFYYIKALMEKPRRLHDAKDLCLELVQKEPFEPNTLKLMGDIYLKAGLESTAKQHYQRAVEMGYDKSLLNFFDKASETGIFKKLLKGIMND